MLQKALDHDEEALALLLQRNYGFVYKYLLKISMNRAMAEDLTQDTMVRAIEHITAFRGQSKFSSWLISIATRRYLDSMRKQKRERLWMSQEQALRALRFEAGLRQEPWSEALDALGQLTSELRVPIILKHYYGYGYDEIAAMLEIPAGTVKSRLHNGLKQVRKELDK